MTGFSAKFYIISPSRLYPDLIEIQSVIPTGTCFYQWDINFHIHLKNKKIAVMYGRQGNFNSMVLFAEPPHLDELCMISVSVSKILQNVPLASRFQIQTIKCREIIFTEPDVIATPAFEIESVFHIILQKALYKTGRLLTRLQKLGLEISKPIAVTPAKYQSCLRYTLLAKLAPNWNKAGEWLIQGRDFLLQAGYANAVKMDLTVTAGDLYFMVDASTVRFPSLKVEDLDIPTPSYNNFLQNQAVIIHQHSIPMVWCQVLPSMKKGKIVSISHELPDDGPFRSYKDIKRHWKNHYGYRLPEDEDGMTYYQINFRPLGEKLFTYPEICLRARDIQKIPRVDPKPILLAFLQDLQKKMPKICGFPLKLHNKAHFPSLDLNEATQVEKKSALNLTSKPQSKKIVYRNTADIQRLVSQSTREFPQNSNLSSSTEPPHMCSQLNKYSQSTEKQLRHSSDVCFHEPQQTTNVSFDHSQSTYIHNINSARKDHMNQLNTSQQYIKCNGDKPLLNSIKELNQPTQREKKSAKIIPLFKSKAKPLGQYTSSSQSSENQHKVIPMFKAKVVKTPVSSTIQKPEQNISPTLRDTYCISDQDTERYIRPTSVPVFHTKRNPCVSMKVNIKNTENVQPIRKVIKGQNINKIPTNEHINLKSSNRYIAENLVCEINKRQAQVPSAPKDYTASILGTPDRTGLSQQGWSFSENMSTNLNVGNTFPVGPEIITECFQRPVGPIPVTPKIGMLNRLNDTASTPSLKRTYPSSNESTPTMKKPRPKQQVQNVDVEILARSNQLNKVNTITLVSWLKDRGVTCKSKDKKGDLVEKAMKLLNLSVSEQ